MSALWSLLVAPAGAAVTTLFGVLVGSAVSRRAQDRHWAREQQTAACARVLRETSALLVDLSEMERARPPSVPQGVVVPTTIDWRPWNEALSMVNLLADPDIAEAAHELDNRIWRMHIVVKRGLTPAENWMDLREHVEAAQRDFVTIARRGLSPGSSPLVRLSGRPEPGDPVWAS